MGVIPGLDLGLAQRVAVDAVSAAGTLLGRQAHGDLGVRGKGSAGDVVTDLDISAERLILDRIRTAFPEHRIIAEEAGRLGAEDAEWTWLVDPLDGTNNLAVALPTYVVGVALCRDRLPVLGVVHDPVTCRTWQATRGGGAFGPDLQLLQPPLRTHPAGPLIAWTQGYSVPRDDATAGALKIVLEQSARRVFQLWTPLLSLVMLARGDIDAMVGYHAEEVDLPAGALIAAEAGIVLYGLDGAPFDERIGRPQVDRSFVACRPEHLDRMLELVHTAERIVPDIKGLMARLPAKL
ncbi:MAG TPA: inositol monophosphatase family protein [Pseudonocardiaceae bacterium]|nr:inositol monophosphatase family protein [Pseudonocardiaceae bacterium]